MLAELNEVVDWYTLGAVLGVRVRKLREIQESNNQGGVQRWKIDMFQSWLDSTPTASWEDVIRALEQLDHLTLAARLRSKYLGEVGVEPSPVAESEYALFRRILFYSYQ